MNLKFVKHDTYRVTQISSFFNPMIIWNFCLVEVNKRFEEICTYSYVHCSVSRFYTQIYSCIHFLFIIITFIFENSLPFFDNKLISLEKEGLIYLWRYVKELFQKLTSLLHNLHKILSAIETWQGLEKIFFFGSR